MILPSSPHSSFKNFLEIKTSCLRMCENVSPTLLLWLVLSRGVLFLLSLCPLEVRCRCLFRRLPGGASCVLKHRIPAGCPAPSDAKVWTLTYGGDARPLHWTLCLLLLQFACSLQGDNLALTVYPWLILAWITSLGSCRMAIFLILSLAGIAVPKMETNDQV